MLITGQGTDDYILVIGLPSEGQGALINGNQLCYVTMYNYCLHILYILQATKGTVNLCSYL